VNCDGDCENCSDRECEDSIHVDKDHPVRVCRTCGAEFVSSNPSLAYCGDCMAEGRNVDHLGETDYIFDIFDPHEADEDEGDF